MRVSFLTKPNTRGLYGNPTQETFLTHIAAIFLFVGFTNYLEFARGP